MMQILAFILLIGPLIFIHELGHLLAAKLVNVKVVRFSLGFGPALARLRIGETEYRIAPIPLGGYVTLLGASPDEPVHPQEQDRALRNKPLWARYLVLGAGPVFNLLLPLFLYFAFYLGHTTIAPPIIGTVLDDSAAAASDLQPGDRIVAIEGTDIHAWQEMQDRVRVAPDRELRIQIEREGVRFDRFVTPRKTSSRTPSASRSRAGCSGSTRGPTRRRSASSTPTRRPTPRASRPATSSRRSTVSRSRPSRRSSASSSAAATPRCA
jgi:regulator of sigma E protease